MAFTTEIAVFTYHKMYKLEGTIQTNNLTTEELKTIAFSVNILELEKVEFCEI